MSGPGSINGSSTSFNTGNNLGIPSIDKRLRYDDMNVSTGGVAREALITNAWTTIYSYTGSGSLFSFLVTLEKLEEPNPLKEWRIRLEIDGEDIFGPNGITNIDLLGSDIYAYPRGNGDVSMLNGLAVVDRTIHWGGSLNNALSFESSVKIYLKKVSEDKKFRAGLVVISKD